MSGPAGRVTRVLLLLAVLTALAAGAGAFVMRDHRFVVLNESGMEPTLIQQDTVVRMKRHRGDMPAVGSIVVVEFPLGGWRYLHGREYVRRVVARGGDTVEIRHRKVIVNGTAVDEPYVRHEREERRLPLPFAEKGGDAGWKGGRFMETDAVQDNLGPVTIPPDAVFVLGDNRDDAMDSRRFGPVPLSKVKGRVLTLVEFYQGAPAAQEQP